MLLGRLENRKTKKLSKKIQNRLYDGRKKSILSSATDEKDHCG